jgi:purine-cytosine permease-like protein
VKKMASKQIIRRRTLYIALILSQPTERDSLFALVSKMMNGDHANLPSFHLCRIIAMQSIRGSQCVWGSFLPDFTDYAKHSFSKRTTERHSFRGCFLADLIGVDLSAAAMP